MISLGALKTLSLAALVIATLCNDSSDWRTQVHKRGTCALYDICGHRADGDVLSCANNSAAQPLSHDAFVKLQSACPQLTAAAGGEQGHYCCTEQQIDVMTKSFSIPSVFLAGCPACDHNFKHLFCLLTCSPDQSTFTNVTEVQAAHDTNATVVKEVSYYVAPTYGERLYNSCKDVVYSAANQRAMVYVGGGARDYQQLLDFVGTVKDKRVPPIGSPYQLNFPAGELPAGMTAMEDQVPPCWDPAFRCSCGDCPDAPACAPPPPPPPEPPYGCTALGMPPAGPSCSDLFLMIGYLMFLVALAYGLTHVMQPQRPQRPLSSFSDMQEALLGGSLAELEDTNGACSAPPSAAASGIMSATPSFVALSEIEPHEDEVAAAQLARYPAAERLLRRCFMRQGAWCASNAEKTLASCGVLLVTCCLGLIWFRIETEPAALWVGPGSRAAQERAQYESSFGPFYRIEQLILKTTSDSASPFVAPSGDPAILTDANIQLLFDMQREVDGLAAHSAGAHGVGAANVTLQDICFKPFGDVCATQSLLQYWQMERGAYESGVHSPDYCLSHWSTQCRSAFGAPMDPELLLGGFPRDPAALRNYSADATALIVTYPVNSGGQVREAAAAWEAAFLSLASGKLSDMAAAANLSLAFSAERSVQDELERESVTDAPTILASYAAMFGYIAVAMATFPVGCIPLELLVHSRAALGLGGVGIVVAAVVGALGLVSWAGLWSTLIIMEVIPFLVLAIGVDNMFILAHALRRQDRRRPMPARMGSALAEVGPSITLAATCEVLAFSLGSLTGMPAIRNFSICAALAVALDFVLQVTAFVALLAMDTQRLEANRLDLAPCIQLPRRPAAVDAGQGAFAAGGSGWGAGVGSRRTSSSSAALSSAPAGAAAPLPIDKGDGRTVLPQAGSVRESYGSTKSGTHRGGSPSSFRDGSGGAFPPPVMAGNSAPPAPAVLVFGSLGSMRGSMPRSNSAAQLAAAAAAAGGEGSLRGGAAAEVLLAQSVSREGSVRGGRAFGGGMGGGSARATARPRIAHPREWGIEPALQWYVRRVHVPALQNGLVKFAVIAVAAAMFLASLAAMQHVSRGLEQSVALPRDSYLQRYYGYVATLLRVGPPLMFVVEQLRVAGNGSDVDAVCSTAGCRDDSLLNQINGAARMPAQSYIAAPAASWLDDYLSWINPTLYDCCRVWPNATHCPTPDQPPCDAGSVCEQCSTCFVASGGEGARLLSDGRPTLHQVRMTLPWFLESLPGVHCAKGGLGAYNNALMRDPHDSTGIAGLGGDGVVASSQFRTSNVPLSSQQDFIGALKAARELAGSLSVQLGLRVYPYSIFHIFFEQYLSIGRDAAALLGWAMSAVFVACCLLTESVWGAALVLGVIAMVVVDMMGCMVLWGIQLNAVSLVNLVMSTGIAVEFCAHLLRAFLITAGSRAARADAALREMGASVLCGITITKFIGVAVLMFAQTQIFEVYYFRMYFLLVLLGAGHGLVLLPVLLGLIGPPSLLRDGRK